MHIVSLRGMLREFDVIIFSDESKKELREALERVGRKFDNAMYELHEEQERFVCEEGYFEEWMERVGFNKKLDKSS